MKKLLLLVIVLGICAVADEKAPLPSTLSLTEAKNLALAANPTLQVTIERLKAAAAATEKAQGEYLPTLDAVADIGRTQEVPRLNGGEGSTHYTTYQAELQFAWTLFDGMARKYNNIAEQLGLLIAEDAHVDAQRSLLLAVATAYYESLLEVENIRIAQEDLKYNLDLMDTAQRKLDHGAGNRSDVLNFQIKAKDAEANLLDAKLALKLSYYTLAQLLGYAPSDLPENFSLLPADDYTKDAELPAIESCIEYAFEHRPDLRSQIDTIQQKEALIDYYDADNLPKLQFYADYGVIRRQKCKFSHLDDSLDFGLQLRWNIFNGKQTRAQVAVARANAMAERAQLDVLRQEIMRQIAHQHDSTLQAKVLANLKLETEKLAEETRNLVRNEYNIGRVTATRLNEAQTDLTNAQGARVKAIIRYWQYRENLDSTTAHNLEIIK